MGGSASYRLGKKISAAQQRGASQEELDELERQRQAAREAEKFHEAIQKAKNNQDPEKAWRVDVHKSSDYTEDKLYISEGGSTIAVTPTGDIISVCKNPGDTVSGSDLLARAVEMGGVKLDSYGGNHAFYTKTVLSL